MRNGKLKGIKIGKEWRVSKKDLYEFTESAESSKVKKIKVEIDKEDNPEDSLRRLLRDSRYDYYNNLIQEIKDNTDFLEREQELKNSLFWEKAASLYLDLFEKKPNINDEFDKMFFEYHKFMGQYTKDFMLETHYFQDRIFKEIANNKILRRRGFPFFRAYVENKREGKNSIKKEGD